MTKISAHLWLAILNVMIHTGSCWILSVAEEILVTA